MGISIDKVLSDGKATLTLLKVLADNSFDSILITDATPAGKIMYANNAFKKLTGYTKEEAIGKTPRILQGPATDQSVINRLRQALETGKTFEGRAINYKKDKTPFIMHWRVLPVKNGSKISGWIAIQREVSGL